jgi:ubiquinone/menaquinone biosynthesis C-methylase UbiE
MSTAPFDSVAERYDAIWTRSLVGRYQRAAVWNRSDPLVGAGDDILDLGCGTGEDALHFHKLGAHVLAVDASAQMVRIARSRGVDARQLRLESLDEIGGRFDGAISNFGVLNCISELTTLARSLARLILRHGFLAICVIGRCCAWEILHFLRTGDQNSAFRRFRSAGARSSLGLQVYYPSVSAVTRAFCPAFKLLRWTGIGLCVPPSYISRLSLRAVTRLATLDRRIASWPLLRAFADHRLLLFQRQ